MKLKRRRRKKFHREIKLNAGKESRLGSNYLIRSIEIPENYFHDVIYTSSHIEIVLEHCSVIISPGTRMWSMRLPARFTRHDRLSPLLENSNWGWTTTGGEIIRCVYVCLCVRGRCVHTVIGTFGSCSRRYDDNGRGQIFPRKQKGCIYDKSIGFVPFKRKKYLGRKSRIYPTKLTRVCETMLSLWKILTFESNFRDSFGRKKLLYATFYSDSPSNGRDSTGVVRMEILKGEKELTRTLRVRNFSTGERRLDRGNVWRRVVATTPSVTQVRV